MSLLPAETLDFSNSQSAHPYLVQGFAYLIELEGFDDGFDFFMSVPLKAGSRELAKYKVY